jgi:prephenate dehydrogenase
MSKSSALTYQHIGFLGLGLIGGSLAMLIRKTYPQAKIFGFAQNATTIEYALSQNIIDTGSTNPAQIPTDLDLVFICTPISLINQYIQLITKHIPGQLTITDVGSIKTDIGQNIPLNPQHTFIGGHPMAGTEKTGITAANPAIMNHAAYLLIQQKSASYQKLKKFLQTLKFNLIELSVKEHDEMVAFASHFPYLMAELTIQATAQNIRTLPKFKQIISTGFRDTTRVASSNPAWGTDVCHNNKANLLKALKSTKKNLAILEKLIKEDKTTELQQLFQQAKTFRDNLY